MSARNNRRPNGGGYSNRGGHSNNFRDDKKRPHNEIHYNNRRTQPRHHFNNSTSNKQFEENHPRPNNNQYHPHHHHPPPPHHFKNKEPNPSNTHFRENGSNTRNFQHQPHPHHAMNNNAKNQPNNFNSRNSNPFQPIVTLNPFRADLEGVDWLQTIMPEQLASLDERSRMMMNEAIETLYQSSNMFYKPQPSLNAPLIPILPTIDPKTVNPHDPKSMSQVERLRDSIIKWRI